MKTPAPPSRSLRDLRDLTPARVGLGRAGASLPTEALLAFTLDHARARDAVHAAFDAVAPRLQRLGGARARRRSGLAAARATGAIICGVPISDACSIAARSACWPSRARGPCQLAIVIGDGLSPAAVNCHAIELVRDLVAAAGADRIEIGHAVVASGARVALGDEIGAILGARMVVMLIGERPGLSAPDSLGAYLTFAPRIGLHRRRAQLRLQHPRRGAEL